MKFWKQTIITSLLFLTIVAVVISSSCEQSNCDNVTCYNGGSCSNGKCLCPTGYENTQCQDLSISRYIGVYAGYTYINNNGVPNNQQLIDSVYIWSDGRAINTVGVLETLHRGDTMHGYVSSNQSTYTIILPEDTIKAYDSVISDYRATSITLQNDNELNLQFYETVITNPDNLGIIDTNVYQGNFIGYKTNMVIR